MTNPFNTPMPSDDELGAFILRTDPTLAERLLDDPEAYIELVARTVSAGERSESLVTEAVAAARHAGCTWQEIGDALGASAQATESQYRDVLDQRGHAPEAAPDSAAESPADTSASMRLFPVTAFDEIAVLNRAGVYGWHSVSYGLAYHKVERDDHQWQHASTLGGNLPGHGEGWVAVGRGWGPFSYWARRLDTPALPGNPTRHQLVSGKRLP